MPWELLPSEDAKIKSQVQEAEATIQHETEQRDPENTIAAQPDSEAPNVEVKTSLAGESGVAKETVGSEADNAEKANDLAKEESTDKKPEFPPSEIKEVPMDQPDNAKDHDDDGGEMMEADEDMVIY